MSINEKINKVDHFTVKSSIDQVANRPAKYQNQPGLHQFFFFGSLVKYYQDRYNRNSRYGYEHQNFVLGLLARKQPKRHPRISNMGQVKKVFNHLYRIIERNMK